MSLLFLPQTQGKQTVNFQFWLLIDLMNWWQRHYPSLLGLMIWLPNNVWKKRPDLDLLDVSKLIKKTRENVNTHLQHRKTALLARGSSLADTVYTTNNSFLSLLIEEGNTLTTNILCVCVCGRGDTHTYTLPWCASVPITSLQRDSLYCLLVDCCYINILMFQAYRDIFSPLIPINRGSPQIICYSHANPPCNICACICIRFIHNRFKSLTYTYIHTQSSFDFYRLNITLVGNTVTISDWSP